MMKAIDVANEYFDAWNARDADAITRTFIAGGTYSDPTTGVISGDAIAVNAKRLWEAFPDLSFEVISVAEAGSSRVAAEWLMTGTNNGPFQGLPPTKRKVSLPGADFIEVTAGGIKAVTGYFDTRIIPDQLGLQVLVQPHAIGPFSFGNCTAVQSGRKVKPGAFSITSIWSDDSDTEEIRNLSGDTAKEMLAMEGFIGTALVRIGDRGVTVTAWEKPENIKQLMTGGTHREAMKRFWSDLGQAAYTSVWTPDHINPFYVRCNSCKKMSDYEKVAGTCPCGEALPEPPTYF